MAGCASRKRSHLSSFPQGLAAALAVLWLAPLVSAQVDGQREAAGPYSMEPGMTPRSVVEEPPDVQAQYQAWLQQAQARYEQAMARCEQVEGEERAVCRQAAESELASAKASAKARREASKAGVEAYQTRRQATYELQRAKCQTLEGESRRVCLQGLRQLFKEGDTPVKDTSIKENGAATPGGMR